MSGYVTIEEVARAAEVSPMTVSNFINGKFDHMGKQTRFRVAEAVEKLNYRPNRAARGLRVSSTGSIGIIIVDESPRYLSDGFTNEVIAGLTNILNDQGLTLQLEGRSSEQFSQSSLLTDVRTDGLCVKLSGSPARRREMLSKLRGLDQPVIVLLEKHVVRNGDVCCITQDDYGGAKIIANHVIRGGARKLLFLRYSLSRWHPVDERERGIGKAVEESGENASLAVAGCGNGSIEEVQTSLSDLIDANGLPDCIMGASDRIGIAALKFLLDRGIRVPRDVKVTGFNASDVWPYAPMRLTTIGSKAYEIGVEAGNQMVKRLSSGEFSQKLVQFPVALVSGETTLPT